MTNKTAIIFPGQGSQKIGMGKEIYDAFPEAREVFAEVDEALKQNLTSLILEGDAKELTKTENTQPALMCVSIAILRVLLKQTGKKISDFANFAAGHSLGEYSALCATNAISLADTAKILRIRGNAMANSSTNGAMAAVLALDLEQTQKLIDEAKENQICQIANDNCNGQIVISGDNEAIDRAVSLAKKYQAKRVMKLPVSGAFHSALMDEAKVELESGLEQLDLKAPTIPIIANVTVEPTQDPKLIKELLLKQLTSMVRWRETLEYFSNNQIFNIVEIGSGKVLSGLAKRTSGDFVINNIETVSEFENFAKQIA